MMNDSDRRKYTVCIFCFLISGCSPHFDYIYFFSETEGTVFLNNLPISNASVKRIYQLGDYTDEVIEKTITNKDGKFTFPHGREYRIIKTIGEAVIRQKILIKHEGKEYIGWKYTNRGLEEYPEIGQKIKLNCNLGQPVEKKKLKAKKNYRPKDYEGLCNVEYNK